MRFTLLALAVILPYCGYSQIIRQDDFLAHGFDPYWKLATEEPFRCVGEMNGGSAVWIGGPYVLYAGHGTGIQANRGQLKQASSMRWRIPVNGRNYEIRGKEWHVPKGLHELSPGTKRSVLQKEKDVYEAFDIAVLRLDAVPSVPGLKPAKLYFGKEEIGMNPVWVGYGNRGTSDTLELPERFGAGRLDNPVRPMAWRNRIVKSDRWDYVIWSTFDEGDKGLPLEGSQSRGSSGGGVFAPVDGEWRLIGLGMHGYSALLATVERTGKPWGGYSGATRISPFSQAIQKGLEGDWREFEAMGSHLLDSDK